MTQSDKSSFITVIFRSDVDRIYAELSLEKLGLEYEIVFWNQEDGKVAVTNVCYNERNLRINQLELLSIVERAYVSPERR